MNNRPRIPSSHIPIWEIHFLYHPSIICCCLDEIEQKRVSSCTTTLAIHNQCNIEMLNKIIQLSSTQCEQSKHLQEILDFKFKYHIHLVAKIKDACTLQDLWKTNFCSGEYQGAYWAIMSHRLCDKNLRHTMYQQVKINCLQNGCLHSRHKRQKCMLEKQLVTLHRHLKETCLQHKKEHLQFCNTIGSLRNKLTLAELELAKRERQGVLHSPRTQNNSFSTHKIK